MRLEWRKTGGGQKGRDCEARGRLGLWTIVTSGGRSPHYTLRLDGRLEGRHTGLTGAKAQAQGQEGRAEQERATYETR